MHAHNPEKVSSSRQLWQAYLIQETRILLKTHDAGAPFGPGRCVLAVGVQASQTRQSSKNVRKTGLAKKRSASGRPGLSAGRFCSSTYFCNLPLVAASRGHVVHR